MIKLINLSYTYPIDHHVFKNLNIEITEGEFWGVLGRNGAGKTTLVDLILGMKYPSTGSALVLDKKANERGAGYKNEIALLSQDIKLNGSITIAEFLKFHSFFYPRYSKVLEKEYLQYFELNEEQLIGSLSTGQQRKVQIVAGLASDTKIIIIDEITAVLDPEARHKFFKLISKLNREQRKTVVLATNIAEDLTNVANKVLYINEFRGEVIEPSKISQIFKTND